MTDEDVYPNWLRNAEIKRHSEDVAPGWPRIKIRVCRTCNRTMNAQFEEPARPVILAMRSGRPMSLGPAEQLAVSRWALKTELLRALHRLVVLKEEPPTTLKPVSAREAAAWWRVYAHRLIYWDEIPDLSMVRVGIFGATDRPINQPAAFLPEPYWLRRHMLSTTDGHGPLLFEVTIYLEGRDDLAQWTRDRCRHLVVLHPTTDSVVSWPPANRLRPHDAFILGALWIHTNPLPYIDDTRLRRKPEQAPNRGSRDVK